MKKVILTALTMILAFAAIPANAQWGNIKKIVKDVQKEVERETKKQDSSDNSQTNTNNIPANNDSKSPPTNNTNNTANDNSGDTNNNRNAADTNNSGTRLVFSNQPIDPANPQNLKTNFKAGEHIYGLLILDKPFNEFIGEDYIYDPTTKYTIARPMLGLDFKVNDQRAFKSESQFVFNLRNKDAMWENVPTDNYFFFDIAPEPSKQKTYDYKNVHFEGRGLKKLGETARVGPQFYSYVLSQLKPGENKISFDLRGKNYETITGEITVSGTDAAFYRNIYENLEDAAAKNVMMPMSKSDNAESLALVRKAVKVRSGEKLLKVVHINPSWYIEKNFGRILWRARHAAYATKAPNGKCYLEEGYFKQYYTGNGRYGRIEQDTRDENRYVIPCDNVNK